MKNLFIVLNKIVTNGFDYSIDVNEPKKEDYPYNNWVVNFSVTAKANDNLKNIEEITLSTINNICLSPEEITSYKNQKIRTHWITINDKDYRFRSKDALIYLLTIFESKIPLASLNFSVSDGLDTFEPIAMLTNGDDVYGHFKRNKATESLPFRSRVPNVNYFILFDRYGKDLNDDVSDFLGSVKTYNFKELNNEYKHNDGTIMVIAPPVLNFDRFNSNKISIQYSFNKVYSMEQLSKVKGYKVQPIIN
jgi:hypothetical protein